MEIRQVDKDLLEAFTSWQKSTLDMHRDNVNLKREKEALQKELEKLTLDVDTHRNRMTEANEAVERLQNILSQKCDMEEENRRLRREISDHKTKVSEEEEKHKAEIALMQDEAQKVKTQLQEDLEVSKCSILAKVEEEKEDLLKTIEDKARSVKEKEEIIQKNLRDHQAELTKLRFEYDTKILKLQKQNTRNQQAAQPAGSNQDIFRKKLQHVRAEADKEISELKRRTSELERQLEARSDTSSSSRQRGPPLGNNSKRIRRF